MRWGMAMVDLPTGTVTFLFTDLEGSSRHWEGRRGGMMAVLRRHEAALRASAAAHGGCVFKTVGDACYVVFAHAPRALAAAVAAQRDLVADEALAGLRVRMALHTGSAEERDGDYFGPPLNRVARLLAAAHGGQIVLSHAVEQLVRDDLPAGVALVDLGEHRLKDLHRPERVFQVTAAGIPAEFGPLRALESRPNNLPSQTTSFIGRAADLPAVKARLARSRLVTLTGVGGAGKTRLALHVAADVLDAYPDGVWFVELASVAAPDLVASAIAAAVDVREEIGRPALATLVDQLRQRRLLVVLDNCEHVVDGAAVAVAEILRRAPSVAVLATSREPLAVAGEVVWPVPPLGIPGGDRPVATPADVAELAAHAAVELFVARAAAAQPAFTLSPSNAAAVAAICRRLDGIPLAIELAAARVAHMAPEHILARLDTRLPAPSGRRRSKARQRTLTAALDWSHDLLDIPEVVLFRRLAVFRGGWSVEATEAVCAGRPVDARDALDILGRLVDKSLVVFTDRDGAGRYRFLEPVRAYANARLEAAGEFDTVRARHLRHFTAVAEVATGRIAAPEQSAWRTRLDAERDNLRAALEWADRVDDAEAAQRLCGALWRHWLRDERMNEGVGIADLVDLPALWQAAAARRSGGGASLWHAIEDALRERAPGDGVRPGDAPAAAADPRPPPQL